MRAFMYALDRPWAITQESLEQILKIALRENLDPQAVAAELGRPLENTHTATVRDGVASIPVYGPIFKRANLFTEVSGATSTDIIARDFAAALRNPQVRGILLDIDSPGGEVGGINELSEMIAAGRRQKPVTAYVGDVGASAAYWLASGASQIVADRAAVVGSIGVVAAIRKRDDKGARYEFVSSQSPRKHADPGTPDGASQVQEIIDKTAQVFIETVARNRNVSAERVMSDFGRGGVLNAEDAMRVGMIDRLGSEEQVTAELMRGPSAVTHGMRAEGEPVTERILEAALRDAGLSRSEAKAIIAGGFKALKQDQRDAEAEENTAVAEWVRNEHLKALIRSYAS
jgi:signal peptide peptidase SppA